MGRCNQCGGKGRTIKRACPTCAGQKVESIQHDLAVHIPAGAPEGYEEVFRGEADESTDWEAGDVMVRVRSQRTAGDAGQGGEWARHESGILGRVVLGVGEVGFCVSGRIWCNQLSCIGLAWV
jgi:DnaJ-related protein SCJ1